MTRSFAASTNPAPTPTPEVNIFHAKPCHPPHVQINQPDETSLYVHLIVSSTLMHIVACIHLQDENYQEITL